MVQRVNPVDPDNVVLEPQQVQSIDNFGPQMGWEFDFAAKHDVAYPIVRTLADIVPFVSLGFPSGLERFKKEGPLGQAVQVGLDLLPFLPAKWVTAGAKLALKPVTRPLRFLGKAIPMGNLRPFWLEDNAAIRNLLGKVDKFRYAAPEERLMAKYGVTWEEANNVIKGRHWVRTSRGQWIDQRGYLSNIYRKDGMLNDTAFKDMIHFQSPRSYQRLQHYKEQYRRYATSLPGIKRVLRKGEKGITVNQVFESQTRRLFGEQAGKMTIDSIGAREFSKVLMDMLYHEGRLLRTLDITSRHYLMPVRKVFAQIPGGIERVYAPIKRMFGAANEQALLDIHMWHTMLASKGLIKYNVKVTQATSKLATAAEVPAKSTIKKFFSRAQWEEAGKVIREMDDLTAAGKLAEAEMVYTSASNDITRRIVDTYREWADYMYSEYLLNEAPRLIRKAGLTRAGETQLESTFRAGGNIGKAIRENFRGTSGLTHQQRYETLRNILEDLKARPETHPRWFTKPEGKKAQALKDDLSFRTKGKQNGILDYLENYAPRQFDMPSPLTRAFPKEVTEAVHPGTASFVKARSRAVTEGTTEDLIKMIERRVMGQSRQIHVRPYLRPILKFKNSMPPRFNSFAGHYIKRLLGEPSPVDTKVAQMISRVFGGMWDERRVMNLAWTINDLIYLGGIGFKPFSAMRNLFQPLLLVPADMGGVKDIFWLARGYRRAILDPKTAKYIRDIGAITEYAPDIMFRPQIAGFGTGISGRARGARDLGMWMFKLSDRFNRYVTGASAMTKWEHFVKKFAIRNADGDLVLTGRGLQNFRKKLNLTSREPYVAKEIDSLLGMNALEDAKKIWVKDVIADTQYLYGPMDAPVISQVGGSVTRTAVVFQSWWMNYGSLLGKWAFRTGNVGQTSRRMFSFMLTGAIGYHLMSLMWGRYTARRATLAGPLPLSVDIPASWRPFQEALKLAVEAGGLPLGITDTSKVKSRMKSVLNTSLIYAPGGLQFKQLARGFSEEGGEGLLKAMIRFQPPKEKPPLRKLLDEIS